MERNTVEWERHLGTSTPYVSGVRVRLVGEDMRLPDMSLDDDNLDVAGCGPTSRERLEVDHTPNRWPTLASSSS